MLMLYHVNVILHYGIHTGTMQKGVYHIEGTIYEEHLYSTYRYCYILSGQEKLSQTQRYSPQEKMVKLRLKEYLFYVVYPRSISCENIILGDSFVI